MIRLLGWFASLTTASACLRMIPTDPGIPANTVCKPLSFGLTNDVCKSKYLCYAPNFVDGVGAGSKKMECPDSKALRFTSDNKDATPACKDGQWSDGSSSIVEITKVMCLTCPTVEMDSTDKVQPKLSERNKEATCISGQLNIEYKLKGATRITAVRSLMCSSDFTWTHDDWYAFPFDSFEDLVSQGGSWKARCIQPCKTLVAKTEESYCWNEVTNPKAPYDCYEAGFYYGTLMSCNTDAALRDANDVKKIVDVECFNAQWKDNGDNGNPIPDTTEVICVRCKGITIVGSDSEKAMNEYPNGFSCKTKKLVVILKGSTEIFPVSSVKCNFQTALWESTGADYTSLGYSSFAELIDNADYALKCMD